MCRASQVSVPVVVSLIKTLANASGSSLYSLSINFPTIDPVFCANENPPAPTEELVEAVNSYKDFINPLDNLKKDTSRRGIDIDGDGTIDGYDNTGDGLIDEPKPSSSQRAKYVMNEKPFYARPNFNWGDRSKWINNQNAVNYWLTFIKNESDSSYPTDFNSKTY